MIWQEWEGLKEDMKQKQAMAVDCKSKIFDTNGTNACEYCGKKIKNGWVEGLKRHYATRHRQQMLLDYPNILPTRPCVECDLMFFGQRDLNNHLYEDHGKLRKCDICRQEFFTKSECLNINK